MPDPFRVTVLRPTSAGSSLVGLFTFGFSKGSTPVTFHNCCLIACKKPFVATRRPTRRPNHYLPKTRPFKTETGSTLCTSLVGLSAFAFPGFRLCHLAQRLLAKNHSSQHAVPTTTSQKQTRTDANRSRQMKNHNVSYPSCPFFVCPFSFLMVRF